MEIFGKKMNPTQLRQRIGHMDQVAGVRRMQFDDGRARPARAALFHTGSGLEFTVALDRGMDITSASFQGKAMGWRSTAGDAAPQYYEPEGIRWLRNFHGGLLTTCGLTNVGGPASDSAVSGVGLHGRFSNLPAEDVQVYQGWEGGEYLLRVQGTMRESVLFGEKLALTRTVTAVLGGTRFRIQDTLVNEGFQTTPFMLLYHCNIGWPALDEGSRVIVPSRQVAPRDDRARDGAKDWSRIEAPSPGYAEKVYYHDMAPAPDGSVTAAVVNSRFGEGHGFGVYVKYNAQYLPRFVQWKMQGTQDYVLGLEPCNCGVEGRAVDEAHGLLHTLSPGESRTFDLEFGAIVDEKHLREIQAQAGKTASKMVDSYLEFVTRPKNKRRA
jgi:hypothetical protein